MTKLTEWMGCISCGSRIRMPLSTSCAGSIPGGHGARALAVLYRDFRPLGNDAQLIKRFPRFPNFRPWSSRHRSCWGPAAREDFCPYRKQLEPMWSAIPERLRNTSIMPFFETFGLKNPAGLGGDVYGSRGGGCGRAPLPQGTQEEAAEIFAAVGRGGFLLRTLQATMDPGTAGDGARGLGERRISQAGHRGVLS